MVSIRRLEKSDPNAGPSKTANAMDIAKATEIKVEACGLFDAICFACPLDVAMYYNDAPLPEGAYDITVKTAGTGRTAWELLSSAYERAFNVRIRSVRQAEDVHLLKVAQGAQPSLKRSDTGATSWGTAQTAGGFGYKFRSGSMDDLAGVLEKYTNTLVINETALQGHYTFELAMDHWKPKTVFAAVRKLGLDLVKAKRDLDVLKIESAGP